MIKFILKKLTTAQRKKELLKVIGIKPKREINLKSIHRILCLQMNAIGDAVMTQPSWATLKANLPDAEIDLMCRPHIAVLFENDPSLRTVIRAENQKLKSWCFRNARAIKSILLKKGYDLIIDFTALPLTAALCADPQAVPSIGFQRKMAGIAPRFDLSSAYDLSFPYSEGANIRNLMLQLVSPWKTNDRIKFLPALVLGDETLKRAEKLMRTCGVTHNRYIVMHPGGKWPPKRWPLSSWMKLIEGLSAKLQLPVLMLGGNDDEKIIRHIEKRIGGSKFHLMISKELDVSAALIKKALLCVCNDSAAMHLAAAVGTPSVAIFGPVSPNRSAPSPETGCTVLYDNAFCSPCELYYSRNRCRRGLNFCMYGITPAAVSDAIMEKIPQTF